jgi:putative IMPACT (imprinted ancient) family translation regulator
MEQIKNVTLQSVDYFSEILSTKTKKATKNEIQYKILNFLSEKGNQTFIDIYNETFSDKKFEEALRILNI